MTYFKIFLNRIFRMESDNHRFTDSNWTFRQDFHTIPSECKKSQLSRSDAYSEKSLYSTQVVAEISFLPQTGAFIQFAESETLFEYNCYIMRQRKQVPPTEHVRISYFPRPLTLPPSAVPGRFFHRDFGRDIHMLTFASDRCLGLEEIEPKG